MGEAYRRSASVFDTTLDGGQLDGNLINLTGPGLLCRLCRKHNVSPRRWNRWMPSIHPDAPLIHRNLHSWRGQTIHLEEAT